MPSDRAGTPVAGSFRDPAGSVFLHDQTIYRRIEPAGVASYRRLMDSGLYAALVAAGLLVPHDDLGPSDALAPGAATVIRPERIATIAYPYEWCPSQLQDAALATLEAQRIALGFGLSLKDASAYNVQFHRGRPVLIDTLSFEPYGGGPWVAYRQFCQHFYAPLLLAATRDVRLTRLAELFIDGVPLAMASRLLPRRSYLRPGPLFHVHLHAAAEQRWARRTAPGRAAGSGDRVDTRAVSAVVDSLRRAVAGVRWTASSAWSGYYAEGESYTPDGFARKVEVVTGWLRQMRPARVWDLGANTGHFSRAAADAGAEVVAWDADTACVDALYRQARGERDVPILPLVLDLANPSPAIGWANSERLTLEQRGPVDLVLALAVIHHLAIGNNVPLPAVAAYVARLCARLVIEFVPASDPMVQQMLHGRDRFADYNEEAFERAFATWFRIDERVRLEPSDRTLYLMTLR